MAAIFIGLSAVLLIGLMVVAPPGTSYRKRLGIGCAVTSVIGLFLLIIVVGTWLFPPHR
jgi:hypothetical protein